MRNPLKALLELALKSTNEGVRQEMQQMLQEAEARHARLEAGLQWQLTEARHGELAESLEAASLEWAWAGRGPKGMRCVSRRSCAGSPSIRCTRA